MIWTFHAIQRGDISAFEQLVARYDGKLLRIAQNVTHNREDSEDAVREAFLKAFEHPGICQLFEIGSRTLRDELVPRRVHRMKVNRTGRICLKFLP
jgi:DNA-directed RNA polymerase specialized sigma24 family protein